MPYILENATADGDGTPADLTQEIRGGYICRSLYVLGDLGGGTITLNVQPLEGESYAPVLGEDFLPLEITDVGMMDLIVRGHRINANLAGSTGANVSVILI